MSDDLSFSKGVLLKGLPFNVTDDQIKTFFKTIKLSDDMIRIIKFADGRPTGVGFVKLRNEDMERALLMDKNHIGERYIEVIPSDETEMHHLVLKARSGGTDARDINRMAGKEAKRGVVKRDGSPIRRSLLTRFAYITGIPTGCQYKEVRRLFRGIHIGMNCVHLLKSNDGADFRGDGYVEFKDNNECRKALILHDGDTMNGSMVRLVPCSQDEVEQALRENESRDRGRSRSPRRRDRRSGGGGGGGMTGSGGPHGGEEEAYFTPAYREREGRYRNTIANMAYGGKGIIEQRPRFEEHGPMDPPPFHDDRAMLNPNGTPFQPQMVGSDMQFRSRSGGIPLVSNHGVGDRLAPMLPGGMGGVGGGAVGGTALLGGLAPTKPLMSLAPAPLVHVERKIIRLEGLPYETLLQEIVEFFHGYGVTPDNVRIQCRDDGSPSGKAFVTLPSEKLAQSALQDLNKRYIRGRYIDLFLV